MLDPMKQSFSSLLNEVCKGNVFTPVSHSVHGGGGGFPACITGHMTGGSTSRGHCIGGGGLGRPPPALQDTVNKWVVSVLLECIFAFFEIYKLIHIILNTT